MSRANHCKGTSGHWKLTNDSGSSPYTMVRQGITSFQSGGAHPHSRLPWFPECNTDTNRMKQKCLNVKKLWSQFWDIGKNLFS
jgi:hypothetical protein